MNRVTIENSNGKFEINEDLYNSLNDKQKKMLTVWADDCESKDLYHSVIKNLENELDKKISYYTCFNNIRAGSRNYIVIERNHEVVLNFDYIEEYDFEDPNANKTKASIADSICFDGEIKLPEELDYHNEDIYFWEYSSIC